MRQSTELSQNKFTDGINMDLDVYVQKNTAGKFLQNCRIFSFDGTTYITTSIGGNEKKFSLPLGYVPVCAKDYNNILYIKNNRVSKSWCNHYYIKLLLNYYYYYS